MVFVNYSIRQIAIKIVYYGPGLSGKTTNLQYIYKKTNKKTRGELISLETDTERTLFFDLLPMEMGEIMGFKTKLQLYTVPGQVHYNTTRKLVLKGVDGIVFVADSQEPLLYANIESLEGMIDNLSTYKLKVEDIPLVFQYNKRDLPNVLPVETLERELNRWGKPYYEASAIKGIGVFETLKAISKLTLLHVKHIIEEGVEDDESFYHKEEVKKETQPDKVYIEKKELTTKRNIKKQNNEIRVKKIEVDSINGLKKELNDIAVESSSVGSALKVEKNQIKKDLKINISKDKVEKNEYFWISFSDDSGRAIKKFKISKEKLKKGALLDLKIDINVK